ncbi:MAG: hypothetical protein RR938_09490 [Muribaculaceae bacterium]
MKLFISIITLLGLLSCSTDAYVKGEAFGEQICKLSNDAKYDQLPLLINKYNIIEDSLSAIDTNDVTALQQGIISKTDNENDTIRLMARILMNTPAEYGHWLASRSIDMITNTDKPNADDVLKLINTSYFIYNKSGEPSSSKEFDIAFQAHIDSLNIALQMKIYTSISTPSSIGKALGNDASKATSPAKIDIIIKQIDEAQKIYPKGSAQRKEFATTFHRTVSTIGDKNAINKFNVTE